MLLYLDYDGVLHHENVLLDRKQGIHIGTNVPTAIGRTLFEWMPILEQLLAPHPNVNIVLATSWVRARSFNYAKKRLSVSLRERVIGATFHHGLMVEGQFAAMSRGMQIWGDVLRREPDEWFAIDDDWFGWPSWCRDKLIRTEGDHGLSDQAVQDAVRQRLQDCADWCLT